MIKKLKEEVINRIAAGESISGPINVIKELIENSLDSESKNIHVRVDKGGLECIQVTDNGTGILEDDFPLLARRHCTSKLYDY